jgi:hypothetical protein
MVLYKCSWAENFSQAAFYLMLHWTLLKNELFFIIKRCVEKLKAFGAEVNKKIQL